MDSRERVFRTLNREIPDRAPRDFWASEGAWEVIKRGTGCGLEQFLDEHDIEAEVKSRFDALGRNGGYIFCTAHNVQADCPCENIQALMGAYKKFGNYG